MELSTIFVLALTLVTVCFLAYVEVKSRRNSASAEQSPSPEEVIPPPLPTKGKRT